jgi:hypothetical protein
VALKIQSTNPESGGSEREATDVKAR